MNRFGKEIAPVITNGPPGVTGFAGGRPKAQEIVAYWPTLVSKKYIIPPSAFRNTVCARTTNTHDASLRFGKR